MADKNTNHDDIPVVVDAVGIDMCSLYTVGEPTGVDGVNKKYTHKELAERFGVSERTVQRKIAAVRAAITDVTGEDIGDANPDIVDSTQQGDESSKSSGDKKKQPPGPVSKGVIDGNAPQGPNSIVAGNGVKRYLDEFGIPETNPLAALEDMHDLARFGSSSGLAVGSGVSQMIEGYTRDDLPYGERVMAVSQGSTIVATALLGLVASLKQYQDQSQVQKSRRISGPK